MAKLKPQHRKLADLRLQKPTANVLELAIEAGYGDTDSARTHAHEVLAREDVKAYLAECMAKTTAVVLADVDRIVKELADIGFSDLTSVMSDSPEGPRFKPLAQWPPEIRRCIASIETTRQRTAIKAVKGDEPDDAESLVETAEIITKIKLWPKVQALELLARYRKMLDGGNTPLDQRQSFIGMQIVVADGGQLNVQVNQRDKGGGA